MELQKDIVVEFPNGYIFVSKVCDEIVGLIDWQNYWWIIVVGNVIDKSEFQLRFLPQISIPLSLRKFRFLSLPRSQNLNVVVALVALVSMFAAPSWPEYPCSPASDHKKPEGSHTSIHTKPRWIGVSFFPWVIVARARYSHHRAHQGRISAFWTVVFSRCWIQFLVV